MSLLTNLQNFATRAATEDKRLRVLINGNATDLAALTTTQKANIVVALNELHAAVQAAAQSGGAQINDAAAGSATTYSSNKITEVVNAAVAGLVNAAPAALDTLKELSDALGGDANFAATVSEQIGTKADKSYVDTGLAGTVKTTGAQSIDGVKTFTSAPVVPDNSFAQSKVVGLTTALAAKADASTVYTKTEADGAFVSLAGTQTVGGTKTFSNAPIVPINAFAMDRINGLGAALAAKANAADVYTKTEIGNPETDLVVVFEAGLV